MCNQTYSLLLLKVHAYDKKFAIQCLYAFKSVMYDYNIVVVDVLYNSIRDENLRKEDTPIKSNLFWDVESIPQFGHQSGKKCSFRRTKTKAWYMLTTKESSSASLKGPVQTASHGKWITQSVKRYYF